MFDELDHYVQPEKQAYGQTTARPKAPAFIPSNHMSPCESDQLVKSFKTSSRPVKISDPAGRGAVDWGIWSNRPDTAVSSLKSDEHWYPSKVDEIWTNKESQRIVNSSNDKPRSSKNSNFAHSNVYHINFNKQPFSELEACKAYQARRRERTNDVITANGHKPAGRQVDDLDQLISILRALKLAAADPELNIKNMDARLANLLKLLNYGQILSRELGEDQTANSSLDRLTNQIDVRSQAISPEILSSARLAVKHNGSPHNDRSNTHSNNQADQDSNDTPTGRTSKHQRRASSWMECSFCKNNQKPPEIYKSHSLKGFDEKVTCPYLRAYDCPSCHSGGGDTAHTLR